MSNRQIKVSVKFSGHTVYQKDEATDQICTRYLLQVRMATSTLHNQLILYGGSIVVRTKATTN